MGWFKAKLKKPHPYLTDTSNWRFASLYKYDITIAIATSGRSHVFEVVRDGFATPPPGDWEARGLVHFDRDGPLIPFEMSVVSSDPDEDRELGGFIIERIQPYNSPDYPEEHQASYLRIKFQIYDRAGEIRAALEKAMQSAAVSDRRFLHVRIGKPKLDPAGAAKEIAENRYTTWVPITRLSLTDAISLKAPATALAWDNL